MGGRRQALAAPGRDRAADRCDRRKHDRLAWRVGRGAALSGVVHGSSGAGRSWLGIGDRYTFLVTGEESGGSLFALDCHVGVGGGPPPHRHLAEDELFVVTEGSVAFTAAGETRTVVAGESIFVPRGVAHAYRNAADAPARMLAIYTPAGMEGWFREVCTPADDPDAVPPLATPELIARMLEAGPRYHVEWID